MQKGGYYLGQDFEWDEAVKTLIQTYIIVLHYYRGLPLDGLIKRDKEIFEYTHNTTPMKISQKINNLL